MHSFAELSLLFDQKFNKRHFPDTPANLYDAAQYILEIGGKRVRPVAVLMANELMGDIKEDGYNVAMAIELFHNFSLIHDDIMDSAPLRRGKATVHMKYSQSTAILAGDVMFAQAYDYLTRIEIQYVQSIISLFNKTSKEVCEGQQLDLDFESRDRVSMDEYLHMVTLKTSVLLAAALQLGAVVGGASIDNQRKLYQFGKNLGIAFQIKDDYLDVFGDAAKFGKQIGGDILANKKTFLLVHALENFQGKELNELQALVQSPASPQKISAVTAIFERSGVKEWAKSFQKIYFDKALEALESVAVLSARKTQLYDLAQYLIERDV